MYASFFGLRELPFNNTPDPRFFYATRDNEEARASLIYAVQERKGFVLLTGEVGAGKTLVSRMMLRHFGSRIAFATINHALGTGGDLLESICTEFELPVEPDSSHTHLVRMFHDFLLAKFGQDIPVVLVLDEAQTLPIDAFEQVRMIGNLEADDAKLLQVAIVGQPELQRMFASPALRQLRQRIFRSFHLPALSREETEAYIHHRLSVAGATRLDIFDSDAIERIYEHSRGLPRIINTLCDNAMLSGYSADQSLVDSQLVESVIRQMMAFGETRGEGYQPASRHATHARPEAVEAQSPQPATYDPFQAQAFGVPFAHQQVSHGASSASHTFPASPPTDYSIDQHAYCVLRDEMVLMARDVRSRMAELDKRLAMIEKRVVDAPGSFSGLKTMSAQLRPLFKRVDSLADERAADMEEVARREGDMRKLAAKAKIVVGEVRRVFDGLKQAGAKTRQLERDAQQTCHSLITQTERAKRLADKLSHLASRVMREEIGHVASGVPIKEASMPVEQAESFPPQGHTAGADQQQFQKVLSNARESLSDLRTFARSGSAGWAGKSQHERGVNGSRTADPPIQRLADEVDSLLQIVEPGIKSSSNPTA
ncbi:MAG: AAA family ATPase [Phycisphaerales bacterium]|nr:MAG: AAA family ATPase [Phycisphaerales bacterium]